MSTPPPSIPGNRNYSWLWLALLTIVVIAGYVCYGMIRDLERAYQSKAEIEEKVPDLTTPEPLPIVKSLEFSEELAPRLSSRLKNWGGLIRVDVTPAKLDSSLSIDKGCSIVVMKSDEGEKIVLRTQPLNNATPKIDDGKLVLEATTGRYVAAAAEKSSLDAPLGRADSLMEITPKEDGTIWVGDHCYRGSLRILLSDGKIRLINVVPLEDYIASVVDSEMPATFSIRGRQAQAIVARSYALYHILTAPKELVSDVNDTTRHQRYLGYQYRGKDGRRFAGETKAGRAIAESTKGIICVHRGDLLLTYFSACCGGINNRLPEMYRNFSSAYHRQEDPFCKQAPVHHWVETISQQQFMEALRKAEPGRNWGTDFQAIQRNGPGSFEVEHKDGRRQAINIDKLQRIFSFRSSFINASTKDGAVVIEGEGHGHSVGLCQWGANLAGQQGKSAEEILDFYYDDIQLMMLPEKLPQQD